ncbi:MAG: malonate decarboxylase holo-[acyl-carrier-protein] synthase [Legionella sp.]|nr:MAG: malonate decarboxylase holo-[acyl-carrier-protein] synthase [Legionella sp.]PJD98372.1 MAG: malonate decarboxylase holo-[acyl-carrier-protein] synthase [Legionella sp.]
MNHLRHTLCYLTRNAYPITSMSAKAMHLFAHWLDEELPFIYPRQPSALPLDVVQLAIPSFDPQTQTKHRTAYLVSQHHITHTQNLPTLDIIFPQLKHHDATSIGIYGSYCWQYLTKKNYVQADSDLDLLFRYDHRSLFSLKTLHQELSHRLGKTIDGEIRFPHWGDCSWPELIAEKANDQILLKTSSHVGLISRTELYHAFPTLLHSP